MSRKVAREVAMQALYQIELNGFETYLEVQDFILNSNINSNDDNYIKRVIESTLSNKEEIDLKISKNLKNWTISRISKVDLSILRLCIAEIFYIDDIPESVSINEAVNLAKKFSDDEASAYINGVLASIVRE